MLIADIKGKLSIHEEHSEDFLTSAVFSVFNYLGEKYLHEFLNQSKNIFNQNLTILPNNFEFEFWPWYSSSKKNVGGSEPDVVLQSKDFMAIIEAKNHGGKHGVGVIENEELNDNVFVIDQLAREYMIGVNSIKTNMLRTLL